MKPPRRPIPSSLDAVLNAALEKYRAHTSEMRPALQTPGAAELEPRAPRQQRYREYVRQKRRGRRGDLQSAIR